MTHKFKFGDEVDYIYKDGDKSPATVIEINDDGVGMWVKWHDSPCMPVQLMPCNRFEINHERMKNEKS